MNSEKIPPTDLATPTAASSPTSTTSPKSNLPHILSTFPIVPQATKDAALQAYRDFAPIPGDPEILALLTTAESNTVEFKSTARWNLRENKKDRTMEEVILKTVAAFLNTQAEPFSSVSQMIARSSV